MNHFAVFGTFAALVLGTIISSQAMLAARISAADNAASTGLMMYMAGGLIATAFMAIIYSNGFLPVAPLTGMRVLQMFLGGLAGVFIVSGSAFVYANVSPPVAVALIIGGQMLVALLAAQFGWTGQEPQPIDLRRIGGLVLFAFAIWLLMPARR